MQKSPILLITFNRPKSTQKVFNALKTIKPHKLYVFNDGPREGNDGDVVARRQIKEIIEQIDWDCDLHKNFQSKNNGCGLGVSGAISWAFENENKLMIIEDDCIPSQSFINYCDHCLEKYKDENQVYHVSGNNYTESYNFTKNDYFFSKFGHIWGWATWKRAWEHFDYGMKDWPNFKGDYLQNIVESKSELRYLEALFDNYYSNPSLPWGVRWMFARMKNGGLSIIPKVNLVDNIGQFGTHTKRGYKYSVQNEFEILNEPEFILSNKKFDKFHFKKHILLRTRLYFKVFRKLKKTFLRLQ